jgi:hypothetical protein
MGNDIQPSRIVELVAVRGSSAFWETAPSIGSRVTARLVIYGAQETLSRTRSKHFEIPLTVASHAQDTIGDLRSSIVVDRTNVYARLSQDLAQESPIRHAEGRILHNEPAPYVRTSS